jgi:hypothetical protein
MCLHQGSSDLGNEVIKSADISYVISSFRREIGENCALQGSQKIAVLCPDTIHRTTFRLKVKRTNIIDRKMFCCIVLNVILLL